MRTKRPARARRPRGGIGAWAVLALAAALAAAAEPGPDPGAAPEARARAFVKSYGYLRFYHPSDEGATLDWDRFAAYGAGRVLEESPGELADRLDALFRPIAPTAEFVREPEGRGNLDPEELRALIEARTGQTTSSDDVVAWQHGGVGLGGGSMYASARTGRENRIALASGFSTATQSIDPAPLRGRRVRLTFLARAQGPDSQAQGWLRVDLENGTGFFDNMSDRPITDGEWGSYAIEGEVAENAKAVFFGFMLTAGQRAWVDGVRLEVASGAGWLPLPIVNGGFEDHPGRSIGWSGHEDPGFRHTIDGTDAPEGERCLSIERRARTVTELFEQRPALGEMLDVPLGAGVRLRAPLALPADLSIRPTPGMAALQEALRRAGPGFDARRPADRLGNLAILWNVFQHFYPYFDQVPTDWERVLDQAIARTLEDHDRASHHETLRWTVAQLHDGHGHVFDTRSQQEVAPLRFVEAEGRVFVLAVRSELTSEVRAGDEVESVGGRPVGEVLSARAGLISGSPQWRRQRALHELVLGPAGGTLELGLIRDGRRIEASVPLGRQGPTLELPEPIGEMADGVFYVDLGRVRWPVIEARLGELAAARGVVFDLRGYPEGNHMVLQHLTAAPLQSAKWNVPMSIYPDREALVGYGTSGRWDLAPAEPRLRGRPVFLTGPGAISYAESVLAIVKHYRLAEIVGSPTAGANGNVNPFELPGGFRVSWTGMRVVNHDDSQHHLLGVTPTCAVEPTVAGVLAGRDEVLEAGLAIAGGRSAQLAGCAVSR